MAQKINGPHHPFLDYKTVEDIQIDFCDFIIGLAETFDGKRLAALQQENKWLNECEPQFKQDQANINLDSAQGVFRNDGNAFLRALEEFAELQYRQLVSTSLSRNWADFFVPLIIKILVNINIDIEGDFYDRFWNITTFPLDDYPHEQCNTWREKKEKDPREEERIALKCWERSKKLAERPLWIENSTSRLNEFREAFDKVWSSTRSTKSSDVKAFFRTVGVSCLMRIQQQDRRGLEKLNRRFMHRHFNDCGVWWFRFQKKLQGFVSLVASNGSLNVDENLQTLQAVNDSRMRYVATMQQTIQQLNGIVSEQQQVITALKFRYLLENLPGPAYTDDKLGERWRKFWGDIAAYYPNREAAKDEASAAEAVAPPEGATAEVEASAEGEDLAKTTAPPVEAQSPLKETPPAREEPAVKVAPAEANTNVERNPTSTTPTLDKLFNGRHPSKYESKGRDLYSDLSEIIHRYKGNTYEIPERLFDPVTSDILHALSPDQKENGNVEWGKEPLRYARFAGSMAKLKKEKAEKAEAADPVAQEKKKQKDDAVQALGKGLANLKAQVLALEQRVKEMGPANAGEKAQQVDKSPDSNSDDQSSLAILLAASSMTATRGKAISRL